ncbi:hypothetical protein ACFX2I_046327 [Malus domestica]
MENILPLSIFLVNLAPSSQIFNQAGPKSNPLPHSESQSSTSRKSTRLAVIFALAFTAVATLRYAPFVVKLGSTMPGPTMPRRRRVGRMGRFGTRKSNLLVPTMASRRLFILRCATLEGTGLSDKDIAALSGGHTLILLQIQTNIVLMVRGLKNLCSLITHALCKN